MIILLLTAFLAIPLERLQVANNDFVDYLTNLTPLMLLIPSITRHNDECERDEDCALIMRCCEVGVKKYCCTPNNFVKLKSSYLPEAISESKNDK